MQDVFASVNFYQHFINNFNYFLYLCSAFEMSHKNKFAQGERSNLLAFFVKHLLRMYILHNGIVYLKYFL